MCVCVCAFAPVWQVREIEFRTSMEETNGSVQWWSIVQVTFSCCCCCYYCYCCCFCFSLWCCCCCCHFYCCSRGAGFECVLISPVLCVRLQTLVVIVAAVWQLYHLKSFFLLKKMV